MRGEKSMKEFYKYTIAAYRKIKNEVEFIDNVLYVDSIAQVN